MQQKFNEVKKTVTEKIESFAEFAECTFLLGKEIFNNGDLFFKIFTIVWLCLIFLNLLTFNIIGMLSDVLFLYFWFYLEYSTELIISLKDKNAELQAAYNSATKSKEKQCCGSCDHE